MPTLNPTSNPSNSFSRNGHSSASCPNCQQDMRLQGLPGHYGSQVNIDVCQSCNMFWFDHSESMQLSPDGVVELFQLINTNKAVQTPQLSSRLGCVRCPKRLLPRTDRVTTGNFNYFACSQGHGRLTSFYQFLIEKKFVRALSKAEIDRLAIEVKQVRCAGCGAPVNLSQENACSYCQAPVTVFDRDAAKKAIDHYLLERKRQLPATPVQHQPVHAAYPSSRPSELGDLALDIVWAMSQFVSASSRRRTSSNTTSPGGMYPISPETISPETITQEHFPSVEEAMGSITMPDASAVSEAINLQTASTAVSDLGTMLTQASLSENLPDLSNLSDISSNAVDLVVDGGSDLIDLVGDGIGSLLEGLF